MVVLFTFGIFITGYSIYRLYKVFTSFDEFNIHTAKDWFWVIVITLALIVTGPTMIYFGYTVPSSNICHITDNHDGTLTSVEYSISGDSTIVNNIKAPKDTYGVVIDVQFHSRMMGKVWHPYTKVISRLNDGRTVSQELDSHRRDIKKGQGMSYHEEFYPVHNKTFKY